jgi:hypothetical protein
VLFLERVVFPLRSPLEVYGELSQYWQQHANEDNPDYEFFCEKYGDYLLAHAGNVHGIDKVKMLQDAHRQFKLAYDSLQANDFTVCNGVVISSSKAVTLFSKMHNTQIQTNIVLASNHSPNFFPVNGRVNTQHQRGQHHEQQTQVNRI